MNTKSFRLSTLSLSAIFVDSEFSFLALRHLQFTTFRSFVSSYSAMMTFKIKSSTMFSTNLIFTFIYIQYPVTSRGQKHSWRAFYIRTFPTTFRFFIKQTRFYEVDGNYSLSKLKAFPRLSQSYYVLSVLSVTSDTLCFIEISTDRF